MLSIGIIHQKAENSKIIRSHKLQPQEGVTLFLILASEKDNITSIIEDHFLETLSGIEWEKENLHTDFSFVSENYNRFIQNIDWEELTGISIIFAVLFDTYLIFSHVGEAEILLVEKSHDISLLSTKNTDTHFHSFSSGELKNESDVYFSPFSLEERLWDDVFVEFAHLKDESWRENFTRVLTQEIRESIDIGYIRYRSDIQKEQHSTRWIKQSAILRDTVSQAKNFILAKAWSKIKEMQEVIFEKKNDQTKYVFLWVWIVILFFLMYSVFGSIFWVIHSSNTDTKNKLIQAKELIEQSQKLTTNPTAFSKNIKEAEEILFSLRSEESHLADTQELLSRIEAMKKEVNDVQTVDLKKLPKVLEFLSTTIDPVVTFESNKKLTILGKQNAILEYIRGEKIGNPIAYPPSETLVSYTIADDGTFFIMTDNNRVIAPKRTDITYVTVTGQNGWEGWNIMKSFNGNLYVWQSGTGNIYKHKPGINGFSAQTVVIAWQTNPSIREIGIDGGIYIILSDGKILRYISGKPNKNITLNKIPGEYSLWSSEESTQLIVQPNLSYIYLKTGNRIWIFSPDAKRFQDVTAWNYVAQLELAWDDTIRDMSIPRDGIIYITSKTSVYELGFDVADGKIILK